MRIALVCVMSLDGRLTRGDDPNVHAWTSQEDWHNFVALRNQHDTLVMERETYEAVKPEPEAARLRVVLTYHPELYKGKTVKDQMEFALPKPKALMAALAKRGREQVLLCAGPSITYDFLNADLVDDIYVSIEPLLFGAGTPFMAGPRALSVQARLNSVKQLNEQGTLLLHYVVAR